MIRSRVYDADMLIRLDSAVAEVIGQDWRSLLHTRFDLHRAIDSLLFLDASSIPSVALPVPAQVIDVHFRVDLSLIVPPDPEPMFQQGSLFSAARPEVH